ncbi:MAG: hypothetical protein R3360_05190, partial [Alphaproteobacteria bacterium]|nr:hypothetical protein [Alphaproteobacteria bacterium]
MDIAVIIIAILLAMLVIAPRLALSSSTSKDVLDRILNYQGIVGLLALVFAAVAFVWLITDWGWPALKMVFFTMALLACVVGLFLLGFLLGYDLIRTRI